SKIYIVNSALVSAHAGTDEGQAWLQAHDAGSGPYAVDEQGQQAQSVSAGRFPDYWEKAERRPDAFVFRRIDESATRRDELLHGNVDIALFLSDHDIPPLASDPKIKVAYPKTTEQTEIVFNARKGPTADARV